MKGLLTKDFLTIKKKYGLLQYAGCLLYCQTCFSEKNIYS